MRFWSIILVLVVNSIPLISNINIEIKDKLTNRPIHGVRVHFKSLEGSSKDSMVFKTTNKKGLVEKPFQGKTFVFMSFIGYETISDTIYDELVCFFLPPSGVMLDEVVVTGHFKPTTTQESVYDIKVINQAKIETQGASNLRELLLTEANMRITQDNILGTSININGISGENVKIMMDGVPIIGRLNGNLDLSQINLNNIKQVEIIEGPMSAIYGSDALGGVINLISKDPNCERMEFDGNFYHESIGVYNFDGSIRYSIQGMSLMINAGRNLFQGFDPVNDTRNVSWNPKEQYFGTAQLAYSLPNHNIRLQTSLFDEFVLNRGALRAPYFESAFDDKYKTLRMTNSFIYDGKLGEDNYISATSAYSWYNRKKNTFIKDMLTLDELLTADPADQDTSDFHLIMLRAVFSDDNFYDLFKYQAGMDLNFDFASGKKIENNEQTMEDYAAFLTVQYDPISTLTIQPSLRFIHNSKYDAPLVPSINLKYLFTSNLILRASFAKGFRAPSIKELYYQFVDINHNIFGNKDLEAETSDSYNASIVYSNQFEGGFISVEPKFFFNKINNMITLALVDDQNYKNINIGSYETIGGNLTLKYIANNISLTTTASYIGRLNSYYEETATRKYNFAEEISTNFDYLIDIFDLKLNIYYKYTGKLPAFTIIDDQVYEYFINDYNMMDLSVSKKFFGNMEASIGVKNVFDVVNIQSSRSSSEGVHTESSNLPIGWGRTLFLTLKVRIN